MENEKNTNKMSKKELLKYVDEWSEGLKGQERISFSNAVNFIVNDLKVDKKYSLYLIPLVRNYQIYEHAKIESLSEQVKCHYNDYFLLFEDDFEFIVFLEKTLGLVKNNNKLINLLKTCEQRSESVFLYKITKQIAEKDSITEGHSYILSYDYERFLREWEDIKNNNSFDENYLEQVGLPVYGMFLEQYLL